MYSTLVVFFKPPLVVSVSLSLLATPPFRRCPRRSRRRCLLLVPGVVGGANTNAVKIRQNRDRFTHRYCMEWGFSAAKSNGAFSCDLSVTPKDAMLPLYDSRSEDLRRGGLAGGAAAVTLGGVGGRHELEGLLQSCREWKGPKVRQALDRSRAGI